jgi:hypothetical protein
MDAFERARESYKDREYLYLFPSKNGSTCHAVNYHAINNELNSFMNLFDNFGCCHKISEDRNHQEVWFEVDEEFYLLAKHSDYFRGAIEKLGVEVVFEYPFEKKSEFRRTIKDAAEYLSKHCYFPDDEDDYDVYH